MRIYSFTSKIIAACIALTIVGVGSIVFTTRTNAETPITRSYTSEEALPLGSIVSLRNNTSDEVLAAKVGNVNNLFGVVVNDDSSLIRLSNGRENQVQVATSGVVPVLASDISGDIVEGDHITASPIGGVGMKATRNVRVVGVAQGGLDESRTQDETYTDSNGDEQTIKLGEVPVLVDVSYFYSEPEKSIIPPALQNVANSIAGRPIEPLPIIISAIIFIVTLIVVASMVFSMIRGSIISVGRNPMSQSAVYRNVIQISALVLVILSVAVISIYMVLTRF